jgi:hypothetical protein
MISEEKMIFGVSPDGTGDGVPLVLLGIPAEAWEYMKDGKTHNFDLTKVGLPIKIIIFGAESHDAAIKMINGHMSEHNLPYFDERHKDFSIEPRE